MEENKKASVVDMNDNASERKEPTVEELKNYCSQLLMQRNELATKLKEVTAMLNKLPWLFEVVKNDKFFDVEFVERCVEEIKLLVSPLTKEDLEEIKDKKEEA